MMDYGTMARSSEKPLRRRQEWSGVGEAVVGVAATVASGLCAAEVLSTASAVAGVAFCFLAPCGVVLILRGAFLAQALEVSAWLCVFWSCGAAAGARLLTFTTKPEALVVGLGCLGAASFFVALYLPESLRLLRRRNKAFFSSCSFSQKTFSKKRTAKPDLFLWPFRGDARDARAATRRRAREALGSVAAYFLFVGLFAASDFGDGRVEVLLSRANEALRGLAQSALVAWYAWLALVAAVAVFSTKNPWLRRKLSVACLRGKTTVGFCLFWLSFVFCAAYVFSSASSASRGLGRLANLLMGLVALPVARNSAPANAAHLSFDDLIDVHAKAGYAFVVVVLFHGLFSAKSQNWTVPIVTIVFGVTAPCLLLAGLSNFIMDYLHKAALALYLATLWHAPGAWAFVLGGILLSVADHFLRYKKNKPVLVLDHALFGDLLKIDYALNVASFDDEHHDDNGEHDHNSSSSSSSRREVKHVSCFFASRISPEELLEGGSCEDCDDDDVATTFVVKASSVGGPQKPCFVSGSSSKGRRRKKLAAAYTVPTEAFSFDAGQYAWIRFFDDKRWFAAHLASSPLEGAASQYVVLTEDLRATLATTRPLEVTVEGPYGLPLVDLVRRKHRVLFVAEDLGVAVCASILRSLALQDFSIPRPTRARLLWTVKKPETFEAFAESLDLDRLRDAPAAAPFSAALHVVSSPSAKDDHFLQDLELEKEEQEDTKDDSFKGPSLDDEVTALVAGLDDPFDALLLASGSPSLLDKCRKAAATHGAAFVHAPFFA